MQVQLNICAHACSLCATVFKIEDGATVWNWKPTIEAHVNMDVHLALSKESNSARDTEQDGVFGHWSGTEMGRHRKPLCPFTFRCKIKYSKSKVAPMRHKLLLC